MQQGEQLEGIEHVKKWVKDKCGVEINDEESICFMPYVSDDEVSEASDDEHERITKVPKRVAHGKKLIESNKRIREMLEREKITMQQEEQLKGARPVKLEVHLENATILGLPADVTRDVLPITIVYDDGTRGKVYGWRSSSNMFGRRGLTERKREFVKNANLIAKHVKKWVKDDSDVDVETNDKLSILLIPNV